MGEIESARRRLLGVLKDVISRMTEYIFLVQSHCRQKGWTDRRKEEVFKGNLSTLVATKKEREGSKQVKKECRSTIEGEAEIGWEF